MQQQVEEGFMVFVADGEVGVGAVRQVRRDGQQLIVNVENGGDFELPISAVRDVHSDKVILDVDRLPEPMREALRHPHDAEYPDPTYAATDPQEGALKE